MRETNPKSNEKSFEKQKLISKKKKVIMKQKCLNG